MGNKKLTGRKKVHRRIRKKIFGTAERPRLCVFRSNREIYAQLIDDEKGVTLLQETSLKAELTGTKVDVAKLVGQKIAEKAKSNGVESVVFDRGGYLYHGRVKSLAEGAREGGLVF
jgi:large subunit ribosomal protein L18